MASRLLQEDGSSRIILEDGSGFLLLEQDIWFVQGATAHNALGGSNSLVITFPATVAGNDLFLVVTIADENNNDGTPPLATTVSSVTAAGCTWTLIGSKRTAINSTFGPALQYTGRCEIWGAGTRASSGALPGGVTTATVNFTNTIAATIESGEYSGIVSIGQVVTAETTGSDPSIALTTQDANNVVFAGFAGAEAATVVYTGKTGSLRESDIASGRVFINSLGALVDNVSVAPALVTCAVTHSSVGGELSTAMVAVELRTVAPAGTYSPAIWMRRRRRQFLGML